MEDTEILHNLLEAVCETHGFDMGTILINLCINNSLDANEIDSFDDICHILNIEFNTEEELVEWINENNLFI